MIRAEFAGEARLLSGIELNGDDLAVRDQRSAVSFFLC